MINLIHNFTETEKQALKIWQDNGLNILNKIDCKCYVINWNNKGEYNYISCFGKSNRNDYFEKDKTFDLVVPRRIIRYYQYYLMETMEQVGVWYVGEKQANGDIEFLWSFNSLEDAFDSL